MKKRIRIIIFITAVFLFLSNSLYAKKINIMVNPFQNKGNIEYSWISHGISDTVISDLNKIREIGVISNEDRSRVLKEMEIGQTGILKDATAVKVGSLMGADLIITGSYLVSGDRIRIDAGLLEVSTQKPRRSFTLEGTIKEIFQLQDRVVLALLSEARKIRIRGKNPVVIGKEELGRIRRKYKPAYTAYQWYCRGLEARYVEPDRAVSFFKNAISIDGQYVDALLKAGYVSGSTLDRHKEAIGFLNRAEDIMKRRGEINSSNGAYLYMVLGIVLRNRGEQKEAEKYYIRSRKIYEKLRLNESSGYSVLLVNMGEYYSYIGNQNEALDLFFKAKDLMEILGMEESVTYAALLNSIGIVFGRKGKIKRALEFYNRSRELKEKMGMKETPNYSVILGNIGTCFFNMNNFKKAMEYYLQAQTLRKRLGLTGTKEYASLLMNIANVYARMKKYKQAIPLFEESKKIWKKLNLSETRSYAMLLMNMGTAYRSNKESEKGLRLYKESKNLMDKLELQNTSTYGNLLINTGVLYYNIKERKTACRYFDMAYRAYRRAKFKGKLKKTARSFTRQCKKKGWY